MDCRLEGVVIRSQSRELAKPDGLGFGVWGLGFRVSDQVRHVGLLRTRNPFSSGLHIKGSKMSMAIFSQYTTARIQQAFGVCIYMYQHKAQKHLRFHRF